MKPQATEAGGKKKMHVATDYYDEVFRQDIFYERRHIDALMAYVAGLGCTRHEWIFDTCWTLYEDYPQGFDLLAYAAKAAHRHGMEFHVVIKPFEGGFDILPLPHTAPKPDGVPWLESIRGLTPVVRPFVAEHPDLRLRRRSGGEDPGGDLAVIRLVKGDEQPTRVQVGDLSIWTSATNNRFERYPGPVQFRESVEWREAFPKWKQCRVLHLEGLQLPASRRYIVVRCARTDGAGDFTNERVNILEFDNARGQAVPITPCAGAVDFERDYPRRIFPPLWRELTRYGRHPEVRAFFDDAARVREQVEGMYYFDHTLGTTPHTLDSLGFAGGARGKDEYLLGNLHPVYPAVRAHWIDLVGYCIDRGVDGVNFRLCNHTRSHEQWAFGFNPPILEQLDGGLDLVEIARLNAEAYTTFLREAQALLQQYNKTMSLHLEAELVAPDDRGQLSNMPPNFAWPWQDWLEEFADLAVIRAAHTLRPWNRERVIDTFAAAARRSGVPLVYQSTNKEVRFAGPLHRLQEEMTLVKQHPGLAAYQLYETANFTRINEHGEFEGSPEVASLIKEQWH